PHRASRRRARWRNAAGVVCRAREGQRLDGSAAAGGTAGAGGEVSAHQGDPDDPVPSDVPGGRAAQREDFPRTAGGVGGEAMAMTALVAGGGGFLGGAIVRRLVEHGDRVSSLARGRYPELEALGVEQHQGDVADAATVLRAAAGCDTVFHVAAKAGVWG